MSAQPFSFLFESLPNVATLFLSALFFCCLFMVLVRSKFRMFHKRRFGRNHALLGASHLLLLTTSFFEAFIAHMGKHNQLLLDTLVGLSGICLTYSAAVDFDHKRVTNSASGTLDIHATVTHGEMMEHVFYQFLNLVQILYLHCMTPDMDIWWRVVLATLVACVWLFRDWFPVNSFSTNYTKVDPQSTDVIRWLYRIKKYQYVFYKHFLLHGLNMSVALNGVSLASDINFRVYWLLLNTSYVMEFFLQTLVKKGYLMQNHLLYMQRVLMLASSIAALDTLQHVNLCVAVCSLLLNFIHRHHDVLNCCVLLVTCGIFRSLLK